MLVRLLAVLCLAGCAAAPPRTSPQFNALNELRSDDYPGAHAILRGFAPNDDDPALRVGDAALLALAFTRDGAVERQLLLLEVADLAPVSGGRESSTAVVTTTKSDGTEERDKLRVHHVGIVLRRFDANGLELARARSALYEETLCAGWWPLTDASASARDTGLANLLAASLQNLANSEPSLQDLLFLLVDRPGLLSIAANLGVHVSVRTSIGLPVEDVVPVLPAAGGSEVAVLPMDLSLNGTPASWAELLVVQPRGASMVCGGLVGAVARHPTETGRSAVVKLMATRRGVAGTQN